MLMYCFCYWQGRKYWSLDIGWIRITNFFGKGTRNPVRWWNALIAYEFHEKLINLLAGRAGDHVHDAAGSIHADPQRKYFHQLERKRWPRSWVIFTKHASKEKNGIWMEKGEIFSWKQRLDKNVQNNIG